MIRIPAARLRALVAALFTAAGVEDHDADTVAAGLVTADMRGQHGHGVARVPAYHDGLTAGEINATPDIRVSRSSTATALVHGDNGLGHLVVGRAVDTAIDIATKHGVAWVGTHGGNHAGAAGIHLLPVLERGMVGILVAVSSAKYMAPWGSGQPLLGTNPVAVAIPAGEQPDLLLDIATSVASMGAIRGEVDNHGRLPEGWLIDVDGVPLTDASRWREGTAVPTGGYKGAGLSLAFGLLAGVLNGNLVGHALDDAPAGAPANGGHTVIVLRPDVLRPAEEFRADVDRHLADVRAAAPIAGGPPVRVPGELGSARARAAEHDGVPVPDAAVDALVRLAGRHGVDLEGLGSSPS